MHMPNPDSDLHMAVTELFDGGIVNNADIASRIAHLILEHLIGSTALSANMPLRVTDRGDKWLIRGNRAASPAVLGSCDLEIRKRDAEVVVSSDQQTQDLLSNRAAVERFASAVLENAAGKEELSRQSPLIVDDKGVTWRVRGRGNANRAVEGPGPFELEVQKRDARVLDMWFGWVLNTPPEVQALLRTSAGNPTKGR
jgi:hypothetical protein